VTFLSSVSVSKHVESDESVVIHMTAARIGELLMWTAKNRARYNRDHLRYPSDLTDAEWIEIAPLIGPARSGGRRREVDVRNLVNGVMYVLSTGCQWRYIPKDFPPKSTVYRYFWDWSRDGTLDRIHDALYVKCREKLGLEASPSACIVDSQSVKSAEKGGSASIRTASMQAS
jgi:putative transposase